MSASSTYSHPELLAETEWLAERLGDPAVRIVDCDSASAYRRAHIPGAVAIPDLGVPDTPSNYWKDPDDPAHVLRPERFAEAMAQMGVGDDTLVVAYDNDGAHYSARLWWVLSYYGHGAVKVLNGGWRRWLREGRTITDEAATYPRAAFTPRGPRQELYASLDDVRGSLGDPGRRLLDVRSDGEWTAAEPRADTRRAGRIPGAVHLEWANFVDRERGDLFKPAEELRAMLQGADITPQQEVITYCHRGVRAAHGLFTLKLLGYERARVYDGSWFEWGNRDDTPVEG